MLPEKLTCHEAGRARIRYHVPAGQHGLDTRHMKCHFPCVDTIPLFSRTSLFELNCLMLPQFSIQLHQPEVVNTDFRSPRVVGW